MGHMMTHGSCFVSIIVYQHHSLVCRCVCVRACVCERVCVLTHPEHDSNNVNLRFFFSVITEFIGEIYQIYQIVEMISVECFTLSVTLLHSSQTLTTFRHIEPFDNYIHI